MIHDATVEVTCDQPAPGRRGITGYGGTCMTTEEITLTATAGHGSYDMRNVPGELRRLGWTVDGSETFCPDCSVERARDARNADS